MSIRHVDVRVFAEGVRIPALNISRHQSRMGGMRFTVSIPPSPLGFSVLPGTLIHVFVKKRQENEERFVLFAEGRVTGRESSKNREGSRMLTLSCSSLDEAWDRIPMGFDIGYDTSFPRPRLKAFFNGLSPSVFENEALPRLSTVMGYQVYRILTGGRNSSLDGFFDLKSVVQKMIREQGPALGIAQTISLIPRIHPLERQSMQAVRFYKRLVAIENSKFTEHLQNQENYEMLKGRIDSLSPQTTFLRQLMDFVLPSTYHHQFVVGSPYFNRDLFDQQTNQINTESFDDSEELEDATGTPGGRQVLSDPSADVADARSALLLSNKWPSTHFAESDFDCNQPGHPYYQKVPTHLRQNIRRLAANVEQITRHLGAKPRLSSAYRSPAWNLHENGVEHSQHLYAKAVDIHPPSGTSPEELYLLLDYLMNAGLIDTGGLGLYRYTGFVHYDIRGTRVDWLEGGGNAMQYAMKISKRDGSTIAVQGGRQSVTGISESDEWTASAQAGVLPSFVIKPNLHFSPPPISNIFFGDHVGTSSAGENFNQSPTRMMMVAPSVLQKLVEPGNPMASMFTPLYFTPNHLQGLVDALTEHPSYSDIRLTGIDPTSQRDDAVSKSKESLPDVDLSELEPDLQNALLAQQTISREQKENAEKDVLSEIINKGRASGLGGLPDGLLSAYSFQELFGGVRPIVSRLPYMQQSTDPEKWVSIYGHYTHAMLSRQARIVNLSMPLNIDVAVGFSGAFFDHSTGWILGEVEAVQDIISADGQASTNVQMGGCAYYGDTNNPSWNRIYEDTLGAFDNFDREGEKASVLFDNAFAPGNIGKSIYEGVLGVGSIVDLAKARSGQKTMTLREACAYIEKLYLQNQSAAEWVNSVFTRRIATEGEVMQLVLEAQPNKKSDIPIVGQLHDSYEGVYRANDWPNGAVFMKERRLWAEDYARDLLVREYALDVTKPTNASYEEKDEALPHVAAEQDYQSVQQGRRNAVPKNNFLGS